MKKYLLAFAFIAAATIAASAQTQETAQPADSNYTECEQTIVPVAINNNHTSPYYQTIKPFYSDVFTTANMNPAVVSVADGVSINGGRAAGTAYYFNGVRIMDNMPAPKELNPVFDIKQ